MMSVEHFSLFCAIMYLKKEENHANKLLMICFKAYLPQCLNVTDKDKKFGEYRYVLF